MVEVLLREPFDHRRFRPGATNRRKTPMFLRVIREPAVA
jgi:hypothetical protein